MPARRGRDCVLQDHAERRMNMALFADTNGTNRSRWRSGNVRMGMLISAVWIVGKIAMMITATITAFAAYCWIVWRLARDEELAAIIICVSMWVLAAFVF